MIDWKTLAAPVPPEEIRWRADGKPKNGRARVVAYTDSEFVRQRLDAAVGQNGWQMTLGKMDSQEVIDRKTGEIKGRLYFVSCSLTLHDDETGPIRRDDVGQGKDPKEAASDSLKRAAHRFGVAAELWRYPKSWGEVDDYGNVLKVDGVGTPAPRASAPSAAPQRASTQSNGNGNTQARQPARQQQQGAPARSPVPACPNCGGEMYDNRGNKRNPKAPDFRCKDKSCVDDRGFTTGAWEEDRKPAPASRRAPARTKELVPAGEPDYTEDPDFGDDEDDLPF